MLVLPVKLLFLRGGRLLLQVTHYHNSNFSGSLFLAAERALIKHAGWKQVLGTSLAEAHFLSALLDTLLFLVFPTPSL